MISNKHDSNYQSFDYDIIDYKIYPFHEVCDNTNYNLDELEFGDSSKGSWFRGPRPSFDKPYFSVLGSAHSFGRFCESPFPEYISNNLNFDCLNLAHGGHSPLNYLRRFNTWSKYLDLINQSKFCLIQVMPGRTSDNSIFKSKGSIIGYSADNPKIEIDTNNFWLEKIKDNNPIRLEALVEETRQNFIDSYKKLFNLITVPKILFYFSERQPDYSIDFKKINNISELYGSIKGKWQNGEWQPKKGAFPQFVNRDVINEIKKGCDHYVEYVSSKGLPHILNNRFTGKPIKIDKVYKPKHLQKFNGFQINQYYPSQQMHIEAAEKLLPACNSILNDS
jgi:hypothetical protein